MRLIDFDLNFIISPDYQPENCDIQPWILTQPAIFPPNIDPWVPTLYYRHEKLRWVRKQLADVDKLTSLRLLLQRLWSGANTEDEKARRLILFVQKQLLHPMVEQPTEMNAMTAFRRENHEPTIQSEPYPEDLKTDWMVTAFEEMKICRSHYLGLWRNPLEQSFTGDWGMGGIPWDVLEMLTLHEGRCGHQAAVTVQLAQIGGMRARLLQLHHHRIAELFVNERWVIADPDLLELGFIPQDDEGNMPTLDWCMRNRNVCKNWPIRPFADYKYDYVLQMGDGDI